MLPCLYCQGVFFLCLCPSYDMASMLVFKGTMRKSQVVCEWSILSVGLGGLSDHIINSATVSSTLACPAFTEMFFEATPILRVAVEPKNTGGSQIIVLIM